MITSLRLQNFRSYRDSAFEFEPGVNIIVGPNASGKTNIVEAVIMLARGSSYRGKDLELVKFKAPWTRLDGFFDGQTRSLKLEFQGELLGKSFVLDDKPYKRLSTAHIHPTVYFEPNHLIALTSGPDARRDYFDELLERTTAGYKPLLASYRRALAQRNALLKRRPTEVTQQIFAWDVRLGELGAQVVAARQALIDQFNKKLSRTYSQIANKRSKAELAYQPLFPLDRYGSAMVAALGKKLNQDLERGFTSQGPHREDIRIAINGQSIGEAASRGETRSLILALKALELELVEKSSGQKPILLLDDVFSELDGSRRQALVELIKGYQTILTTTDADAVVGYLDGHKLIALTKK